MKRRRHGLDNGARASQKRVKQGGSVDAGGDMQHNSNVAGLRSISSTKKRQDKRKRARRVGTEEKSLVALGMTRKEKGEQEKKKTLDPDEYTVGWICALSKEAVPALLLLDEEHERLPGRVNDENSYYFGRMGEHNVIIATLPKGSYGVTSAATVVTHLVTSFSSIRFCLMVGIGAGIPALAPDMRLGDVVVSTPDNHLPGVVEFDMGTELHDCSFTRKGSLNRPPVFLLTAAATLETEISLARSQIPDRIAHAQQRHTANRGRFSHPGKDQDRLFSGEYPCESDDGACGTCDMSRLVARPFDRSTDPIVHFGTIASGSKLVRNPRLRDQIGKSYKALCIEMEAAGIMNNLPCLVIRGICDYADSHKNDIWQHYAAMTASACARELLGYVTAKVVRAECKARHRLEENVRKVDHRLREVQREMRTTQQDQQTETILQGLITTSFEKRHEEYRGNAGGATWRCVLDSGEFQAWYETNDQRAAICCWGEPGVGKSCMMSVVVDRLKDDHLRLRRNSGLAYVYCKHEDQNQTTDNVIKILVAQLVEQRRHIPGKVVDMLRSSHSRPEAKLNAICDLFDIVWILVDAVDEWDYYPRKQVLHFLSQIRPKLRLFITGRKLNRCLFLENFSRVMEIHLRAAKADLEAHIGDTVRDSEIGCSTQDFERVMTERIIQRAEGNFLFADSLVKFVLAGDHLKERRRRLTDLPDTVEDAFADMIKRALSHTLHTSRRKQILTLVAFAERPLTLKELLHALEIDDQLSNNPSDELTKYEIEERDWMDPADLQARCLGLVIVDESDSTVRFFHRSLHEYLRTQDSKDHRRPIAPSQTVQDRLFRICLRYLELTSVLEQSARMAKNGDVPDLGGRGSDGLISYAAAYWGHHLRKAGQWEESLEQATRYLARDFTERYLSQWYLCNALPKYYRPKELTESFLLSFSDLHIVAYFGLQTLVPRIGRRGDVDIDTGDTNNATALHWAAGQGFSAAVETLAATSAGVEEQDVDHSPPLVWLMDWVGRLNEPGNEEMDTTGVLDCQRQEEATEAARVLLGASNCINMYFRLGGGRSLTHFECRPALRANQSLPNTPDIWYEIGSYQTLLMRAAAIGWECVTKELLIRDADPTVRNDRGWTALHFAAKGGHESIAKLLLNEGADPNAQDYYGFIPSDVVNRKTAAPVYQLLQDVAQESGRGRQSSERNLRLRGYKAEIERVVDASNTPSELESRSYQTVNMTFTRWDPSTMSAVGFEKVPGMCERLNEVLSDPTSLWTRKEASGVDPPEPVLWAAYREHGAMIHILLQRGGRVDGRDHYGRTALSWVAQRGNSTILAVLLQHQADVDARDAEGRTPLSWAAENGHRKAARVLLTHGASIETVDEYQRTPLLWAVVGRHVALVKLILKHSANSQNTDVTGQPALAWAAAAGDVKILKSLLGNEKCKASLESQDQDGCTPLARAAAKGHEKAVQILLNAGANPNTMDRNKRTPLLWAAKEGHVGIMKILGTNGASLQVPDNQQRSPLAWAAGRGHTKAVKYLLKQQVRHLSSDSNGVTPLAWAAAGGHVKIVKLLLKNGASPSSLDIDGRTPVSWATQMEKTTMGRLVSGRSAPFSLRRWFCLQSPDPISFGGSGEMIHAIALPNMSQSDIFQVRSWWTRPSHGKVIQLLLKQRIAIDQPDRNGRTPLSLACEKGNQSAVDLLLKYGADPNTPDNTGRSPLFWATGQRTSPVFAAVLRLSRPETLRVQDNAGRTPVSWAAGAGNVDAVRELSLHGVDLNLADDRGRTPLSWAVEMGSFDVVALLVQSGADVNCIDRDGRTLLSWSTASGREDMVKVILRHQENPDIKDATGRTPISWIGSRGVRHGISCAFREASGPLEQDIVLDLEWREEVDPEIVQLLVEQGADLNSTDQSNRAPLSWVAGQGLTKVVEKMLELGAKVDARDQNGRTPLSWAVETGSLSTVEKLLEHGADAGSTDNSNQSILDRSLRAGSKEITNRLLSMPTAPNIGGLDLSVLP